MNNPRTSRRASRWRTLLVEPAFRRGFAQRQDSLPLDDSYADDQRKRWLYEIGRLFHASRHSAPFRGQPLPSSSTSTTARIVERALTSAQRDGDFPLRSA